jgi:hypothetical protein
MRNYPGEKVIFIKKITGHGGGGPKIDLLSPGPVIRMKKARALYFSPEGH